MTRTRLLPFLSLLLLASCARGSTELRFALAIDIPLPEFQEQLVQASIRVIERRTAALESTVEDAVASNDGERTVLTVRIADAQAAEDLTIQLTRPFSFLIVREAGATESGTTIEGHGAFVETGMTEDHLVWARWTEDPTTAQGAVQIELTKEGAQLLKTIVSQHKGKALGILVHGVLVSMTRADDTVAHESLFIRGIPRAEIAEVFVDDLNVGAHVTFTPLP